MANTRKATLFKMKALLKPPAPGKENKAPTVGTIVLTDILSRLCMWVNDLAEWKTS
jgi:hypothetical protein